jgi:hypothetical protein
VEKGSEILWDKGFFKKENLTPSPLVERVGVRSCIFNA